MDLKFKKKKKLSWSKKNLILRKSKEEDTFLKKVYMHRVSVVIKSKLKLPSDGI